MSTIIPIIPEPARRFETELNGIRVFLTIKYNYNAASWTVDIEDSEGIIVYGLSLLPGADVFEDLRQYQERFGGLYLIDITKKSRNPTSKNLGIEFILLHYTPDELSG